MSRVRRAPCPKAALRRAVAAVRRGGLWGGLFTVGIGTLSMIALGQLYSIFAGGSCTILCRPHVAGSYGAVAGLVVLVFQRVDAREDERRELYEPAPATVEQTTEDHPHGS